MRLSICIPTYNFGAFIGETLESILPQLVDGVEIVILDGGSTDDTANVVGSFAHPAVRYHRQETRGGIDGDLARTIHLASGEYCWVFCADDLMKPDAVGHGLDRLGSDCDLYLCGFTLCTLEMRPLRDHPVARIDTDEEFDLSSAPDRRRYFEKAHTTPAFFSFAGSLIVKKARWTAAGPDERFVGSLWAHVAQVLRMIPLGLRLHFITSSLLYKRTGNDSFMDRGIVDRYAKAIDGYHRIAAAYFPEESPEARSTSGALSPTSSLPGCCSPPSSTAGDTAMPMRRRSIEWPCLPTGTRRYEIVSVAFSTSERRCQLSPPPKPSISG